MKKDIVIVLDCGATNIRAIAVDASGNVAGKAVKENFTINPDAQPDWHHWPFATIMQNLTDCCLSLIRKLEGVNIRAVTVTSFGVDGTLVDREGNLLYPVISWKCPRTIAIMENIERYLPVEKLKRISGVGQYSFNTIYKLIWLKENRPDLLEQAHCWLFMSSLITFYLTGEKHTDRSMAGTSQLLDVKNQVFSHEILAAIGITAELFPPMIDAGEIVGNLKPDVANSMGLPAGLPVVSSGHDTQFALFGSGAAIGHPVLSSGTWEILMVRSRSVEPALLLQDNSATCELDSCKGLFNPGTQYLASGVLEWIRKLYWPDVPAPAVYELMKQEARGVPAGCEGVTMNSDLMAAGAGWSGVKLTTHRGHFYRSAMEALSLQLKEKLSMLEKVANFTTRELMLVGGGSNNEVWNQIKANTLQCPIKVLAESETTVLGAAMFAWAGCGYYPDAEQARQAVNFNYYYFEPR